MTQDEGMATLVKGERVGAAFRRTAQAGAAFVPGAVDPRLLERLARELEALRFEPAPRVVGEVRQETEGASFPGRLPVAARALRDALVDAARGSGIRGLRTWRPNDVEVQRYEPGALGITAHRDGKRFRRLVAVVTVRGRAGFAIRAERHGRIVAAWEVGPGDLVLMRGPGLAGARDGRPFHEVSGPLDGVRSSVAFRMVPG
jgi:alkylated DNA repair dioxygenase AlkB